LNVDALRATRSIKLTGSRLASSAIPEDGVAPVDRSLGSQDALRNRTLRIAPASTDEPLPISHHARERHRALSDIQQLKNLVAADPNRLGALVRGPFEVEPRETIDRTSMRMPPFMRQSNAFPLTLAAWQYELLMRWVAEVQRPAAAPAAAGPGAKAPAQDLSEASARRRGTILQRLSGR
jgi:hypothetical protein